MKQIIKKVPIKGNFYADEYGIIYEFIEGEMLKCVLEKTKTHYLCLNREKYGGLKLVHRLVALAYKGDIKGKQVDHIDRNIYNNIPGNLQILSKEQHLRKTRCCGNSNEMLQYYNKLTLRDRDEIFVCLTKHNPAKIAKFLNMAEYCVNSVYLEYKELSLSNRRKRIRRIMKDVNTKGRVEYMLRKLSKMK